MPAQDRITVHCWLPNLNLIALGIGAGAALVGTLLAPLLLSASWCTLAEGLAGVVLLTWGLAYCRVTVTPWEVRALGSGLWKSRYRCPLEEAAIGHFWLLPELAARAAYYSPCLDFSSAEDWDTGVKYVEIEFYGEQVLNCFRYRQLPALLHALRTMADRRAALETLTDATPHA